MSLLDSFEKLMNEPRQLTLTVESGDEAAEIFLLDCTFNRIGIETGREAEFKVDPGIYSVKVRTGSDFRTKSIVLHEDKKLIFEPISFSTPAPLEGTAKTHEYQVANAANHSRTVHVNLGQGSEIYIFARDWTPEGQKPGSKIANHNPVAGLSLQDGNGKILVDLERSAHIDNKDKDRDPWAACNIELNPGNYRLCLGTAGGYVLQQTIVASPGWQTQVFLLQRNYGLAGDDLRADLPGASIFMSRIGDGFRPDKPDFNNPDEPDFRLSELARQALMNDRQRLSENILKEAIDRKSINPMMAIFGAQLMLRNETYDGELIKKVVSHLRDLVQIPHPDIEAIAIKANVESSYIFEVPPMLRNSWSYVLEASVKNPGLVPVTSSANQTTGNLWSEGLWLVWRLPTKQLATAETEIDDMVKEQFKKLWQLEASATDTSNLATDRHLTTKSFIIPDDSGDTEVNDAKMLRMVKALGVPRSKVDSMLKDLSNGKR